MNAATSLSSAMEHKADDAAAFPNGVPVASIFTSGATHPSCIVHPLVHHWCAVQHHDSPCIVYIPSCTLHDASYIPAGVSLARSLSLTTLSHNALSTYLHGVDGRQVARAAQRVHQQRGGGLRGGRGSRLQQLRHAAQSARTNERLLHPPVRRHLALLLQVEEVRGLPPLAHVVQGGAAVLLAASASAPA
jgi:hypothetical protein